MGDTENSFQSKKRGALREISRDNPGLDDEEDSEQEGGTFKKASEEVLATRRIVSVRRKPKAAPAPNPFAGIKLVAPTASVPINPEAPAEKESADEKAVSNNDVDVKTEKGKEEEEEVSKEPEENKKTVNDVETEADSKAPEPEKSEEDKAENEEKKEDVTESAEKKKDENTPLSSFQQLSSSQNAFTNLSGTGFSTSTFSFGPIKTDGSGFGSGSGSLFGMKTDGAPSFGLGLSNNNNGSSSLFGGSGSGSSSSAAKSSDVAPMKEVEVETGEENEEAVFSADSILYEFTSTGWKERGKGEVKINVSKAEKEKARLVMRARGNYRLILNANVFPDMKFEAMDKKGLSFACLNSTGEGSGGFSTFALKFRDRSVVEDFRSAVAEHRGKSAKPAVLKTPENSPKASDE